MAMDQLGPKYRLQSGGFLYTGRYQDQGTFLDGLQPPRTAPEQHLVLSPRHRQPLPKVWDWESAGVGGGPIASTAHMAYQPPPYSRMPACRHAFSSYGEGANAKKLLGGVPAPQRRLSPRHPSKRLAALLSPRAVTAIDMPTKTITGSSMKSARAMAAERVEALEGRIAAEQKLTNLLVADAYTWLRWMPKDPLSYHDPSGDIFRGQ